MPVNEILAPYYLKVKWNSGIARHLMHIYFETGSSLNAGAPLTPNDRKIQGASSLVDVPISEVVFQVFNRAASGLRAGTAVESIEIWKSEPGANTFVQNNDVSSASVGGSGPGVAASYYMEVYAAADRSKYRLTFFEWLTASPQRYPFTAPPSSDDGHLGWYLLKGLVPFATNDGKRLTTGISSNVGYNRRLARSYGRAIAP